MGFFSIQNFHTFDLGPKRIIQFIKSIYCAATTFDFICFNNNFLYKISFLSKVLFIPLSSET